LPSTKLASFIATSSRTTLCSMVSAAKCACVSLTLVWLAHMKRRQLFSVREWLLERLDILHQSYCWDTRPRKLVISLPLASFYTRFLRAISQVGRPTTLL